MSATEQWKSCLEHLDDMKLMCLPASTVYSAIVSAALRHGEIELGRKLLQEMLGIIVKFVITAEILLKNF